MKIQIYLKQSKAKLDFQIFKNLKAKQSKAKQSGVFYTPNFDQKQSKAKQSKAKQSDSPEKKPYFRQGTLRFTLILHRKIHA